MTDGRPLWAHSKNVHGRRHPLTDHLHGTAELARRFAAPFGGGELAYWLGLVHDVGKASCAWQAGLDRAERDDRPVGIDHKTLGAKLVYQRAGWPVALAALGHHGGLQSREALRSKLRSLAEAGQRDSDEAYSAAVRLIPDLAAGQRIAVPEAWRKDPLVHEMAVRLLFSALCDADFLDTSAHFDGHPAPRTRPSSDFAALRDHFEKRRDELLAKRQPGAVDHLREAVYRGCVEAAAERPQIFRLPAPTGAGKTIAAAGFGLHHAAIHGHRRVIVAVPFLTITEQNASVYRYLLDGAEPEPVVLEHHSGVRLDSDHPARRWQKLAAENWDAPFVVTTFVRLFESLFGRRPAQMRRVHRLAGAVIILDEVQALPHAMLLPILDGLRTLVQYFGTTVVLSSATQPDFWHLSPFASLPATNLVRDPASLARELRRVRFEWRTEPEPTLAEVAAEAAREPAAMVVVNTTADAKTVYDSWRSGAAANVAWHLSTRMCPMHRKRVLEQVRKRLLAGEQVLLVSTQLIEAGVDVDFPVVFRAMSPADSLLQAAGRANREGKLPELGRVVVFAPSDGGAPPSYRRLIGATKARFGPDGADPDDEPALRSYYRAVYDVQNLEDKAHVGQSIQRARQKLDFQTVTDGPLDAVSGKRNHRLAFRLIDDDGIAVVTPQAEFDEGKQDLLRAAIARLRQSPTPLMEDLRLLQPYTTNLHRSVLKKLGVSTLLHPILGGELTAGSLAEWVGAYDPDTGIGLDPGVEEYVL